MAYDTKCWDLAAAFLSDTPHLETPDRIEGLAQHIQTEIESWITHAETNYEPRDPLAHVATPFADNH